MTTGERIKNRRKELNLTAEELGAKIGVNRSTVYRYEKGDIEKVPVSTLEPFADALHTTVAYLMGWTDEPVDYKDDNIITNIPQKIIDEFNGNIKRAYDAWIERTALDNSAERLKKYGLMPIKHKKFRMLGEIACGKPIFCNEEYDTFIDASANIDADFCLKAKGDSMINARIYDGDIVFIKQTPMVNNGEIAAVIVGDEATLKRVYYNEDNKLVLSAENPQYAPLVYTNEELNNINILGRAVAFMSYVK